MRFLFSVVDHATGSATPDEMSAIDAFNARLDADGHLVLAAGLEQPSNASVIDHRGPDALVTAGPIVDSPEYMAGFWIIEAPSHDAALDLAAEASRSCNRRIEVRALLGR